MGYRIEKWKKKRSFIYGFFSKQSTRKRTYFVEYLLPSSDSCIQCSLVAVVRFFLSVHWQFWLGHWSGLSYMNLPSFYFIFLSHSSVCFFNNEKCKINECFFFFFREREKKMNWVLDTRNRQNEKKKDKLCKEMRDKKKT